ncbi:MAG: class I SAM-dependent RNA methyltransferase [Lachnospiraceae bacterium]|nr:class I SAM-dependent RNA methyltransferase [Lachnospiraceae bacterium]
MDYEFIAPCHFGLEAVLKREILALGLEIVKVEDGKVTFKGDESAFARANIFLRTTERVLLKVGSFKASTFDELFEGTKALPWEKYIPADGRFWVTKANSVRSALFSPSDIQSIMKKAMVERMKAKYGIEWFSETGADYAVRVSILKDEVTVGIDTSGDSLHKRGYRKLTSKAPITETLAAAIILHTPWKPGRILVDPFCGSGTFPIEAALIGMNIAPGINRSFAAENFSFLDKKVWEDARSEANDMIKRDAELDISGYDIDSEIVKAAVQNAKLAGVSDRIHFEAKDVKKLADTGKYGFIITNPPYGERMEDKKSMPALYKTIGDSFSRLDSWSWFIITGYEEAEKYIGRQADKNRKIYNGMLKSYLYEFMGPKPPKNKDRQI